MPGGRLESRRYRKASRELGAPEDAQSGRGAGLRKAHGSGEGGEEAAGGGGEVLGEEVEFGVQGVDDGEVVG
jgi:hypothetical protein